MSDDIKLAQASAANPVVKTLRRRGIDVDYCLNQCHITARDRGRPRQVPCPPRPLARALSSLLVAGVITGATQGASVVVGQDLLPPAPALAPGDSGHIPRAIPIREDGTPLPLAAPASPRIPKPWADPQLLALKVSPGEGPKASTVFIEEPSERTRRWRLGLNYFRGTENSFGELFTGDIETVEQDGLSLSLGYLLAEHLWFEPLNLLVQGSVMWHDEKDYQDDFAQYTASLKFEWTSFPWNKYLSTRVGFATGISYASHIPAAEVANRGSTSSQHFLHYLEPSVSLNCGDLYRLVQLDHLFSRFDDSMLDHTWLVGSIPHRSGAWGLYGNDNEGDPIHGGSNYLVIGIETEF